MAQIKISYRIPEADYRTKREKRKPYPTCKRCRARLTDEISIKRGYGHKCFSRTPAIIVLEIVPDEA